MTEQSLLSLQLTLSLRRVLYTCPLRWIAVRKLAHARELGMTDQDEDEFMQLFGKR